MTQADKNLPSLEELGKRIDAMRPEPVPEEGPNQSQGMAIAMRVGIELVAGTGVGAVAGYFLDQWLGTMPLFLIICFLLGTAAGVRAMIRTTQVQQVETEKEIAAEDATNPPPQN